ncbi:glycosyltransferase family 2 protein, partial [Robertkochia marina]
MRLSILISMYNSENYIEHCLKSVLNQDIPFTDYEILVADDGSTDGSYAIVKNYADRYSNIKLIKGTNEGVYTKRNLLMRMASGKYLYHLDADDYIAPNCLSFLLKITEQHDLDILGFGSLITYDHGYLEPNLILDSERPIETITGKEMLLRESGIRYETWWYFIKASFFNDAGIWFEVNNRVTSDANFTIELFIKASKAYFLELTLHYYFQSENSLMRNHCDKSLNNRLKGNLNTVTCFNELAKKLDPRNSLDNNVKEVLSRKMTILTYQA